VVSFGVIALHTLYLWALLTGGMSVQAQMWLALVAYAAYVINAAQFLWKLRLRAGQCRRKRPRGQEVSA
jgi:3-vinyl bacteriochlorophyllide hydratase